MFKLNVNDNVYCLMFFVIFVLQSLAYGLELYHFSLFTFHFSLKLRLKLGANIRIIL